MSMRALDDLREMFCKELDEIAGKPEMSAGDLDTVHKLTDTIKNIDKICLMDESCEYSQSGDWEMQGRGMYGHGSSYARGRDSRGRYTSNSRTRYSRTDAKERMIDKLENMLDETHNDKERSALRRCIEQLDKA